MDHFQIVQALCRAAMADPSPALRKQIERLRDALVKDGESKQAGALASILTAADRTKELSPSRIERSKAQIPGEVLGRNTPVPVDRETAAGLAEIITAEGDLRTLPSHLPHEDPRLGGLDGFYAARLVKS